MVSYADLLPLGCSAILIVAVMLILPPGVIAFTVIITTLIAVLTTAATKAGQPSLASTQILDTEIIVSANCDAPTGLEETVLTKTLHPAKL